MIKNFTLWLLLVGALAFPAAAQTFPVDTLVKTGPLDRRINLVFVPDGYRADEMPLFLSRVNDALNSLFAQSPFREYRPYFNAFAVEVPSDQSGVTHPRSAADCYSSTMAAGEASTYFNSTFDFGGIHRLLVPQKSAAVGMALAQNFPSYDQVFVLVNTPEYGGSGGQYATFSAHEAAAELAVHEFGHSFGNLSDEYWAGAQYARESANMTQTTDPAAVRWAPWLNTDGVGIYPHSADPTWQKPHQNCKMQYLGSPFCAVCQETFVERIHSFASPLQAHAPAAPVFDNPTQDLSFALTLLAPSPNTLQVTWTRNGVVFARNTDAVTVPLTQLPAGTHVVRAVVVDTTALTRHAPHLAQHSYAVEWTVNRPAPLNTDTLRDGVYRLVARHSGKSLEAYAYKGRASSGDRVQQWDSHDGLNQQWVVERRGDGAYTLTNQGTRQRLDVRGNGRGDGNRVWQYAPNNSSAQRWIITPTTDGYYKLVHKGTTKCLDVVGGESATDNGVLLHQWEYYGNQNQQWKLERLDNIAARRPAPAPTSISPAPSSSKESVQVYPNPARNQITVSLQADADEPVQVEVHDALARRVARTTHRATAGLNQVPVPLGELPDGVYTVLVQRGTERTMRRLVVVN